jgi:hypothetical protein
VVSAAVVLDSANFAVVDSMIAISGAAASAGSEIRGKWRARGDSNPGRVE